MKAPNAPDAAPAPVPAALTRPSSSAYIRDVVAEMRDGLHAGRADVIDAVNIILRAYANRVEDAAARERAAHIADIHDMLYAATGIPGDAAAMRAALELCVREMCRYCRAEAAHTMPGLECLDGCEALRIAKAALSAPPRNCDAFRDASSALRAYASAPVGDRWGESDWTAFVEWLLAPAVPREEAAR